MSPTAFREQEQEPGAGGGRRGRRGSVAPVHRPLPPPPGGVPQLTSKEGGGSGREGGGAKEGGGSFREAEGRGREAELVDTLRSLGQEVSISGNCTVKFKYFKVHKLPLNWGRCGAYLFM